MNDNNTSLNSDKMMKEIERQNKINIQGLNRNLRSKPWIYCLIPLTIKVLDFL